MSSSSQNPAPVSTSRAFADLAAAIDRRVSSDQAAELLANFRNAIRAEVAADFEQYGKTHDTLSWGQAFYIARDGLIGEAS